MVIDAGQDLDFNKIENYLYSNFEVKKIKRYKIQKKTINIQFESVSGLDYRVTLDKDKFKKEHNYVNNNPRQKRACYSGECIKHRDP